MFLVIHIGQNVCLCIPVSPFFFAVMPCLVLIVYLIFSFQFWLYKKLLLMLQEFRRIKGNILSMKEHAELLTSVREDISEYKVKRHIFFASYFFIQVITWKLFSFGKI